MNRPVTDVERQILIAEGSALQAVSIGFAGAAPAAGLLLMAATALPGTFSWPLVMLVAYLLVVAMAVGAWSWSLLERARNAPAATPPGVPIA